ncbi:MAG: hypothetical protein PF450_06840, partial [Bacteroidales bacterium]|nr:hypothetical protein [Bacteroidales bacterium]
MHQLKIYSIVLLLCISLSKSFSQKGIPYLTFIETKELYEAKNWAVCQGDQGAMLFANRRGLLKYDGNKWSQIIIPGTPLIIKQNPFDNKVYVISEDGYGFLKKNDLGVIHYESLSDT